MHWHLAAENLRFRVWEGQAVVYDPFSGDTHCLDHLASNIVTHLSQHGSSSLQELTRLLGPPPALNEVVDGTLFAALGELERLRIIRRSAD
jgi:PqqD family protein of HPr-rel-A system